MKKYSAIIIGAGGQGALADAPGSGNEQKIISFAHAVKKHSGFYLSGFYDIDNDKSLNASEIWGGATYCCIAHAIGENDIAIVTTNDNTHYEILKELAQYSHLKLVISEKPLCNSYKEAKEIVELYKNENIHLLVSYPRVYQPYYEDLKQKYQNGEFGKLILVDLKFNSGLYHTGSHAMNYLDWFGFDFKHFFYTKLDDLDYRLWSLEMFFEKYHWREKLIGDQPVWDYYDKSIWYVIDNAYKFLEGTEAMKCSSDNALRALELCDEFNKISE
jgi:predicted dehydrogenase